jgi:biopolymer transport protein ExbD
MDDITGRGFDKIDIVPLVAVCLVLVAVFMVTSPLLLEPPLQVNIPKAVKAEPEEDQNVTITISANGEFAVNDKKLGDEWRDKLREHLLEALANPAVSSVIISADKDADFYYLAEAMDIIEGIRIGKENKVEKIKITIACEKEESE